MRGVLFADTGDKELRVAMRPDGYVELTLGEQDHFRTMLVTVEEFKPFMVSTLASLMRVTDAEEPDYVFVHISPSDSRSAIEFGTWRELKDIDRDSPSHLEFVELVKSHLDDGNVYDDSGEAGELAYYLPYTDDFAFFGMERVIRRGLP